MEFDNAFEEEDDDAAHLAAHGIVQASYYFFCGVRTTLAPALLTFFLAAFLPPFLAAFLATFGPAFVPTFFLVAFLPAFLLALRFVAIIYLRVSPTFSFNIGVTPKRAQAYYTVTAG